MNGTRQRSVLLVGGDLSDGGGVNRVIRDLSTIFAERLGLDVTVLAMTRGTPSYSFPPQVRIEHRPEGAGRLGFWRLMREMSRRPYDHVIGFWHEDNIRIAAVFAAAGKAPILTEHTSWHHARRRTRLVRPFAYAWAKAVCVLNPAELTYYRRKLRNVILLPNPVPPLPLPPGVGREKLIIAVGHLIDRKNFRDALLAMAGSGLAAEGWRLAIIGSGPERQALEAQRDSLGLEDVVDFVEPTSEIAAWYARASLMLVTSKIEVFSLVLAEAMAAGVVPLAYAVDGPAFLLEAHPDLLAPPGDVDTLGTALGRLGRSPALGERSRAIMAVIETRFSEEVVSALWRDLLDR